MNRHEINLITYKALKLSNESNKKKLRQLKDKLTYFLMFDKVRSDDMGETLELLAKLKESEANAEQQAQTTT